MFLLSRVGYRLAAAFHAVCGKTKLSDTYKLKAADGYLLSCLEQASRLHEKGKLTEKNYKIPLGLFFTANSRSVRQQSVMTARKFPNLEFSTQREASFGLPLPLYGLPIRIRPASAPSRLNGAPF